MSELSEADIIAQNPIGNGLDTFVTFGKQIVRSLVYLRLKSW